MTLSTIPNNLPSRVSSFVGRTSVLAEIVLRLPDLPLLTLTGTGGAGKTRLAVQAATQSLDQFPDGILLVELAGLVEGAAILPALAALLGVRDVQNRPLIDQVQDALRDRRLLLILDNCEHVIEESAALAQTLLQWNPSLRLLATSRMALGVPGEVSWRVQPLETPGTGETPALDQLGDVESVQLFVDRARDRRSDFELTSANAAPVIEICRGLDGLPLALELAAARVASLPIEIIASQLDERFELLTGGRRTALPRQQTLRALVDWSYNLLDAQEQALFRRLAVFRGGWNLDTATEVCTMSPIGADDLLGLMLRLVENSLVQVVDMRTGRCRLLETLREYGQLQLEALDEATETQRRFVACVVALGEQAEPELTGPDQGEWLDRLETEHDNLRAVMAWSASSGEAEPGMRLGGAVWRFWFRRGHMTEGRQQLERLLPMVEDSRGDTMALALALHAAGTLALQQGDYDTARSHLSAALTHWRARQDEKRLRRTLHNLGNLSYELGDYRTAESYHQEELVLKRRAGDKWGEANTLHSLGLIARTTGESAKALEAFEASLALFAETGDDAARAATMIHVAESLRHRGDVDAPRQLFRECLEIGERLGDQPLRVSALSSLVLQFLEMLELDEARKYLVQLDATGHVFSRPQVMAESLRLVGLVALEKGDLEQASLRLEQSLELQSAAGHARGISDALQDLAVLSIRSDDLSAAVEYLDRSLSQRYALGNWPLLMETIETYIQLAIALGDRQSAVQLLDFTSRERRQHGSIRTPLLLRDLSPAIEWSIGEVTSHQDHCESRTIEPLRSMEEAIAVARAMASSMNWERVH